MPSSDVEDADLRLAIALSLQKSSPAASTEQAATSATVHLTSDTEDEDDDMRRAIALSLKEASRPSSPSMSLLHTKAYSIPRPSADTGTQAAAKSLPCEQPQISLGIRGMNRKLMEQERLARLGKRKRALSPDQSSKKITGTTAEMIKDTQMSRSSSSIAKDPNLQYPTGVIKRTFATKFPRTDDITIDEVLQADSVDMAVISSFMWDAEWVMKKLNPLHVKQMWIMHAKGQDVQKRWASELSSMGIPNLRLHFPPMDGMIQTMHSKLMLLSGKNKLRIVVPTANMTPIEWGEVENDWQPGVMENSVFLVDIPRRSDGTIGNKDDLTVFGRGLVHFLEEQRLDKKLVESILKFDFSQTSHLAFVHAIGGVHKGEQRHPTGLSGLAKAVKDLQLDDVKAVELDYASASLGAINDDFLQRMHLATQGKTLSPGSSVCKVRDCFRIYFPTEETVRNSMGGPGCGGIICLARKHYEAATFPRECLRNYDSTRRGMLSHNKLLLVRGIKADGKPCAWVYVGSANLSESAWGAQKVLKSGQLGSLYVRNWECGVVMAVPGRAMAAKKLQDGAMPTMDVFDGTVEVPFACPEAGYGQYGDQAPWFGVGR
ncbi:hypothetical protein ACEQ8H_008112 [Pleosporales sp. CAS-2024a]